MWTLRLGTEISQNITLKSKVNISQNFVAFSEYMNFNKISHANKWMRKKIPTCSNSALVKNKIKRFTKCHKICNLITIYLKICRLITCSPQGFSNSESPITLIFKFKTKKNIILGNEKTKSGYEELTNSDYVNKAEKDFYLP